MERNRFVRRFMDEDMVIYCIICEGLVNSRTFKECPKHVKCFCRYNSINNIVVSTNDAVKLFDNTKHTVVSTITECGSDINKCRSEMWSEFSCGRCNFTIAKNEYLNGNYKK